MDGTVGGMRCNMTEREKMVETIKKAEEED